MDMPKQSSMLSLVGGDLTFSGFKYGVIYSWEETFDICSLVLLQYICLR